MNDLRFALRQLLKFPGFAAAVVLTLVLGIGSTTTVFCWIQSVLLRPFPGVRDPGRLVVLCSTIGSRPIDTVSYPNVKDYATLTNTFAGVIASQMSPACLTIDGQPQWIYGQITTANFFEVLGVRPALGRFFLADEERARGGAPVLVISHALWQQRFGGDPAILNRAVDLNRHTFTIVGVAPPDFRGTMSGLSCDFWAPIVMHQEVAHFGSLTERSDNWLHTIARLQPGVAIPEAQVAADTVSRQLEQAYPDANREKGLQVLPPYKSPWGGQAYFLPVLKLLLGVSLGVLLIVAANVANLLLARALGRQKEIAIRMALGVSSRRLLAQLMTESLVFALLGGVGGTLMAHWTSQLFELFVPNTYLPVGYTFHVNAQTLLFTLAVTLATALLFGLMPALQLLRTNLHDVLKEGGRTSASATPHLRLRSVLVASEVALALLLLVGAGLCLQGFRRARQVDPGFDPKQSLVAGLRLGAHGYTEETGILFYRRLHERLSQSPGVRSVALSSWFPLGFEGGSGCDVAPEGYQRAPNEDTDAGYSIISPRYFETMRIRLLEGRDFRDTDDFQAPRVAVVNEALAQRFWPGQSALGRRFEALGRTLTIVGVVATGKYRALSEPPRPYVYLPYTQGAWDLNLGLVVRTEAAPEGIISALRREIHALDQGVEVWAALSYVDYIQAVFLAQRVTASLLVVLGSVALLLASLGIYGVMAYVVGQRRHEIGLRMALGAGIPAVIRLIMGRGMALTGAGMLAGLVASIVMTRLLAGFLYGVNPLDPLIFASTLALLGAVAAAACLLPALRAAQVDPVVALRGE